MNIKLLETIMNLLITPDMREVINTPDLTRNRIRQLRQKDLLDSFSPNQFTSKINLINHIDSLNILTKESEIVIFGSWYGSILIPAFYNKVKKITCIDQNKHVTNFAKYTLFKGLDVEWISDDVFATFRDKFKKADLFINTSCENMRPMRDWGPIGPKSKFKYSKFGIPTTYKEPWWDRVSPAYFAFQSHNIYDIHDSVNCVKNIKEFKKQLPDKSEVLIEDETPFETGTRFTLIGKI
jgi:hypothetical protein|tara:strand:- start:18 stop:731 length:714 start_codon:yes stop_codon:yes gene_type:complete